MRITAKLDTAPVGTYYGQLAAALNQGQERTIRMEAAATVRRAMQLDPVRPIDSGELSDSARRNAVGSFFTASGSGFVSTGRKGHTQGLAWMYKTGWRNNVPLYRIWSGSGPLEAPANNTGEGFRLKDADWNEWKAGYRIAVLEAIKMSKARVGARWLTQKSWFELLLKIAAGEPVNAPQMVMRARPVKGGSRTVVAAIPNRGQSSFSLTVVNDSGIAIATGGQRKLNTAISIRRKFFLDSLNKGFLSDASFVARNYKWATVSG